MEFIALLAFAAFSETAVALPAPHIIQPAQVFVIAEDPPKREPDAPIENRETLQPNLLKPA